MTDLPPPSSAQQAPPRVSDEFRSLRRSRSDRVVAGVLGGLGRRLGIDPVVLRVVTVVLAIFGGAGVLLYAAAWLFVPAEGEDGSVLDHALGRREERRSGAVPLALVLAVVAVIAASGIIAGSWDTGMLFLLAAAGLVALLRRRDDDSDDGWRRGEAEFPPAPGQQWADPSSVSAVTTPPGAATPGATPAAATASGSAAETADVTDAGTDAAADPGASATAQFATPGATPAPPTPPPPPGLASSGWPDGPDWTAPGASVPAPPPPAPPPPKTRSVLGPITFCIALVAVGIMAVNDASWANIPAAAYVAVPLGVIGAGLLVGARYGRSRGLIVLGILLTMALVPATWASQWNFENNSVNRVFTSVAEIPDGTLEHGAGSVRYDLSRLPLTDGQSVELTIEQGAGDMTITVPANVDVEVNASVGAGDLVAFGEHTGGFGQEISRSDVGRDGPGGGEIVLNLDLGAGELEVTR